MDDDQVNSAALHVLESAWSDERGYCWPHKVKYPHLWLWDSCFHSIAWSSLHDKRAVTELSQVMRHQFRNGFLPHMVYYPDASGNTVCRGPIPELSSFTQPPVYALSMEWSRQNNISSWDSLTDGMLRGLRYLTTQRFCGGLAFVVHPWETGCDDSPRWDSWYPNGVRDPQTETWEQRDTRLVESAEWGKEGDAIWNKEFVCAPSLFNAILSNALFEASLLTGDPSLSRMSKELGEAMDELMWDDSEGMYVDRPLVGGGDSCRTPVLDGVLSALGTVRRDHALTCLKQLRNRFKASWGLRYLPPEHPLYLPEVYWRGPAWPQLAFLAVQACRRWAQDDIADDLSKLASELAVDISRQSKRGIVQSDWSEYWNPETGRSLGARPQTWAALAAAM
jgi:hypothetical protein